MNEKKPLNYASIDYAKFLLALMVIAIHEMPLTSYSRIINAFLVNAVCRIAVPLFFISTGFFLIKKGLTSETLKRYVLKIFKVYLIWSFVYFVLEIGLATYYGEMNFDIISDYLIELIGGGYGHLWYLYSSIIGVTFAWILFTRFNLTRRFIVCFSVLLYVIGAVFNDIWNVFPFASLLNFQFGIIQHSLFTAVPFVLFGGCISHYYKEFDTATDRTKATKEILAFIMTSGFFLILEDSILFKLGTCNGYQNNLFMFPLSGCVFIGLLNFKVKPSTRATKMRFMSTYIYLVQGVFIAFVDMLFDNSLLKYMLVVALCVVFAELAYWIKRQKLYSKGE